MMQNGLKANNKGKKQNRNQQGLTFPYTAI